MTSLRYAACLPRPLVFFELSLPFVNVVGKMPPKSKEIDSRKELREGERGKTRGKALPGALFQLEMTFLFLISLRCPNMLWTLTINLSIHLSVWTRV